MTIPEELNRLTITKNTVTGHYQIDLNEDRTVSPISLILNLEELSISIVQDDDTIILIPPNLEELEVALHLAQDWLKEQLQMAMAEGVSDEVH